MGPAFSKFLKNGFKNKISISSDFTRFFQEFQEGPDENFRNIFHSARKSASKGMISEKNPILPLPKPKECGWKNKRKAADFFGLRLFLIPFFS